MLWIKHNFDTGCFDNFSSLKLNIYIYNIFNHYITPKYFNLPSLLFKNNVLKLLFILYTPRPNLSSRLLHGRHYLRLNICFMDSKARARRRKAVAVSPRGTNLKHAHDESLVDPLFGPQNKPWNTIRTLDALKRNSIWR